MKRIFLLVVTNIAVLAVLSLVIEVFGLDRKLGDRAGFRRNEQMLSLKPRFVIAFQGNGVTERLVIEAKARGLRVVDRRGPLGSPPSAARRGAG